MFEKKINIGGDADEPGDSGIGEGLEVIVMGLFDAQGPVPRVVFCKGGAKGIETAA